MEARPAGEKKHGPNALINRTLPVVRTGTRAERMTTSIFLEGSELLDLVQGEGVHV
jgi:glucosamine 6-phosphate synthetase-like amidotransferase/phosphosugar isomerase protein